MTPRAHIYGKVIAFHFWMAFACLCIGCADTSRSAGMVAARITGQSHYVSFMRVSEADSAALFPFEGMWWRYHPSEGSRQTTAPANIPPPLITVLSIRGAEIPFRWTPIPADLQPEPLENGCLPLAIWQQRRLGGNLIASYHHIAHVKL